MNAETLVSYFTLKVLSKDIQYAQLVIEETIGNGYIVDIREDSIYFYIEYHRQDEIYDHFRQNLEVYEVLDGETVWMDDPTLMTDEECAEALEISLIQFRIDSYSDYFGDENTVLKVFGHA